MTSAALWTLQDITLRARNRTSAYAGAISRAFAICARACEHSAIVHRKVLGHYRIVEQIGAVWGIIKVNFCAKGKIDAGRRRLYEVKLVSSQRREGRKKQASHSRSVGIAACFVQNKTAGLTASPDRRLFSVSSRRYV